MLLKQNTDKKTEISNWSNTKKANYLKSGQSQTGQRCLRPSKAGFHSGGGTTGPPWRAQVDCSSWWRCRAQREHGQLPHHMNHAPGFSNSKHPWKITPLDTTEILKCLQEADLAVAHLPADEILSRVPVSGEAWCRAAMGGTGLSPRNTSDMSWYTNIALGSGFFNIYPQQRCWPCEQE